MDAPRPCKKIAHKALAGAERHMARLAKINARYGYRKPGRVLHCYQCPICSTDSVPIFHVGHQRKDPPS
jgi:hypothetical protein